MVISWVIMVFQLIALYYGNPGFFEVGISAKDKINRPTLVPSGKSFAAGADPFS
jgi:hypothetical protein